MPPLPCLLLAVLVVAGVQAACASSPFDRQRVSDEAARRVGQGLRPGDARDTSQLIPPGVSTSDGLTEDEAVALALWNNALFQADLAALGVARGDLVEAGMIRNPLLTLLLPLGPKQLELSASLPLESLWQRPRRVAAAKHEVERVAHNLVGSALDVVRDVRRAYADAWVAGERERLGQESQVLRQRIAGITGARLKAGDISQAEASLASIDAETAAVDVIALTDLRQDAQDRLAQLLGFAATGPRPALTQAPPAPGRRPDEAVLIKQALALRPDLRAAELGIEAAAARAGWEKTRILGQVTAIVDANAQGKEGFEVGPGFSIELPLFHHNRGGMARARAELERATWQYALTRQRIGYEVRSARREYLQAALALGTLQSRVLPTVALTVSRAEKAYTEGEASHLFVLEAMRQLIDARLREADLRAALWRAGADLDRGVGKRLPP